MVHSGNAAGAMRFLSKGAGRVPVEWVRPLSRVTLVVPYYHLVSDFTVPHVSHLYRFRTVAEFRSDIEYFVRRFEPVTLGDIVNSVSGKRTLSRPCFHLTFDDGFTEMHEVVAPILHRAGVPATFFLNTAFLDGGGLAHHNMLSVLLDRLSRSRLGTGCLQRVESLLSVTEGDAATLRDRILSIRYSQTALVRSLAETLDIDLDEYVRERQPCLSSEQVSKLLHMGFSIGSHSHDHPLYSDLPLTQQLEQTRTSIQLLDKRFGLCPKAFAFPHTDRGVESAFFTSVFSTPLLDVSFGTGGLRTHFHPRNIERVSMEKTSAPAADILSRQFVRATYFRFWPN